MRFRGRPSAPKPGGGKAPDSWVLQGHPGVMEDFSRELGALGAVARRDHITALTMFAEDLRDSPAQAAQLAAALQTKVEEVSLRPRPTLPQSACVQVLCCKPAVKSAMT